MQSIGNEEHVTEKKRFLGHRYGTIVLGFPELVKTGVIIRYRYFFIDAVT